MKKKPAAKPEPPDIPIREIRQQRVLLDSDLAAIYGVTPGDYAVRPPALDRPELLLVARRS